MSVPDYYKLLEISPTATFAEIKAAFRRLAKLYHPDKNTGYADEEKFKQIKEAYETLINTQRRLKYDSRRNQSTGVTQGTTAPKRKAERKNYNFTEEEAKRRQYYQQHYKTGTANSAQKTTDKPTVSQNELKYILISVPVAVALLLLIIRIYEKPAPKSTDASKNNTAVYQKSDIGTSESPYRGIFGKAIIDTNSHSVIKLMNRSGYDALVFLENDSHQIIRHHFIANNYQLMAENLPPNSYHIHYWLGNQFSYKEFLFDSIMGNFRQSVSAYSENQPVCIHSSQKDTFSVLLEDKKIPANNMLKKLFGKK